MNGLFNTVPSFTINKKEFFLLWVKHYLICLNKQILTDQNEITQQEMELMIEFKFMTEKLLEQ